MHARLTPLNWAKFNGVTALWQFGKSSEKMLKCTPFSFAHTRLMWRKEEQEWAKWVPHSWPRRRAP